MKWMELSVDTPAEYVEPLSEVFYRYGHGGVAVQQRAGHRPDEGETPPDADLVTVKTYIPLDDSAAERRGRIDLGVRLVAHLAPISSLRETVLEEEEWESAWKQYFHVLRIGKRIVVVPTWRDHQPQETDIVIQLDPGMAFGTGHHPTTRMCIELLEEVVRPGIDVLDLGCGSGILSIVAAKLGAGKVLGLEVDAVAVKVAKANVRGNEVAGTAKIVQGTLPRTRIRRNTYDIAVANISAAVISELAGDLVSAVSTGGTLIASGILVENEGAVARWLEEAGAEIERRQTDGDWVALVARRR